MASVEIFAKDAAGNMQKRIASAPVGAIFAWAKDSPPEHCLECNGATLTTAAYPELAAVIAEPGATSFALPDLRGEFVRGWDHGRGVDSGRSLNSLEYDTIKSHRHTNPSTANFVGSTVGSTFIVNNETQISHDYGDSYGDSETRPRNVALMYVIVYE